MTTFGAFLLGVWIGMEGPNALLERAARVVSYLRRVRPLRLPRAKVHS